MPMEGKWRQRNRERERYKKSHHSYQSIINTVPLESNSGVEPTMQTLAASSHSFWNQTNGSESPINTSTHTACCIISSPK